MSRLCIDSPHLSTAKLIDRLQFSKGTKAKGETQSEWETSAKFEIGAYVARRPWKPFQDLTDSDSYVEFRLGASFETIGLIKIPESVVDSIGPHQTGFTKIGARKLTNETREIFINQLQSFLKNETPWSLDSHLPDGILYNISPGRRANTTMCSVTRSHVGLHLDCFDCLPARERWKGSSRICINLGVSARFFQFLPVLAFQMPDLLQPGKLPNDGPYEPLPNKLARAFMEKFPHVPALRLRLEPGEAYLAPTENVIHDGCAETGTPDTTLTVRGVFQNVCDQSMASKKADLSNTMIYSDPAALSIIHRSKNAF